LAVSAFNLGAMTHGAEMCYLGAVIHGAEHRSKNEIKTIKGLNVNIFQEKG
jgi:hypothetical protein